MEVLDREIGTVHDHHNDNEYASDTHVHNFFKKINSSSTYITPIRDPRVDFNVNNNNNNNNLV